MPPSSISEVLFDVDGVLVYPPFGFRDYLEREHGITPKMTEKFFRGRFQDCVTGVAELHDELPNLLQEWGWRGTLGDFLKDWLRQDDLPDHQLLALVAATRERGIRCHIASVQERRRAAYLLDTMGFGQAFDKTFFSCHMGAAKPDMEFYLRAQSSLGRQPRELLLVDDSLTCINAARSAGWQTFHYAGPADQCRLATVLAELAQ
jgi:putative hydrolase of the HAD superfamily